MNQKWIAILMVFVSFLAFGQQDTEWFYFKTNDASLIPFEEENGMMVYSGNDPTLKTIFDSYEIYQFKKTQKWARKEFLERTYFARANSKNLLNDLLQKASHKFVDGEIVTEEDKKIYEPNDYGLTSTIGANEGLPVNLDYMDFLGVPKAWYYTTGNPNLVLGISDGSIDTTQVDFNDRTKWVRKAPYAKGHGMAVASYAAAKGDNGHGIPGVCYDCSLSNAGFSFESATALAVDGAKVINCSWSTFNYVERYQDKVNELFKDGVLFIGSSGNKGWRITKGKVPYYPASYKNVISVGTVMYKYPNVQDNVKLDAKGNYYAENIRGYVGRTVGFDDNDPKKNHKIWATSTANLNDEVDILAPSVGVFRVSAYLKDKTIEYIGDEATSPSAPLVSGTVGLLFSLYPCLPVDEVESILKITSLNIDAIEANKRFRGKYGAGILQTGDAVELVYKLYNENETAYIKDQDFSRWDFKITAHSKELRIQDQNFRDKATLNVRAKNQIVLGENTHLKPNANGSVHLRIDPSLQKECELVLRDPSILED